MKKALSISIIFLAFNLTSFAQTVGSADSIKIISAINTVFTILEKADYKEFEKISTDKIYCILCNETANSKYGPYMIKRKVFFDKHLNSIKSYKSYQRALKLKEIKLIKEGDFRSDITAFITTYEKDEWAKGHEGEQLGIYFRKIKGKYMFAGIETIP